MQLNIKNSTGANLDLAREEHRLYMNKFTSAVNGYLVAILEAEKRAENLVISAEKKAKEEMASEDTWLGCVGCVWILIGLLGLFTLPISPGLGGFLLLLLVLIPIGAANIDMKAKNSPRKKAIQEEKENTKKIAIRMKEQAENRLQVRIEDFIKENSI